MGTGKKNIIGKRHQETSPVRVRGLPVRRRRPPSPVAHPPAGSPSFLPSLSRSTPISSSLTPLVSLSDCVRRKKNMQRRRRKEEGKEEKKEKQKETEAEVERRKRRRRRKKRREEKQKLQVPHVYRRRENKIKNKIQKVIYTCQD